MLGLKQLSFSLSKQENAVRVCGGRKGKTALREPPWRELLVVIGWDPNVPQSRWSERFDVWKK